MGPKQMLVGLVLDQNGNPVCSELRPGNTADRLRRRSQK
jgi:hypothetical protein